jgi:chromate transporter
VSHYQGSRFAGDGRDVTGRTTGRGGPLREVAGLFLKLGFIAFGGPAAHIAMMRDEVVRRRRWVTDQQFLDLLGASNLIPGPTSTELAIYLGYTRAGPWGLVLAGALFILPAMLMVVALAWAYVRFGATPQLTWILYGIKPVIIAIVVQAIWGLAPTALRNLELAVAGVAVVIMYSVGINSAALLFGVGILVMLLENMLRRRHRLTAPVAAFIPPLGMAAPGIAQAGVAAAPPAVLGTLFLTFLKIGAVVYGSGYVLLAFLRQDFVERLRWLTDRQLIDAVVVGQFTPGPVFTTATFIGYLVGGVPGALLATLGIFLPSCVFVALVYPIVPRLRRSPWTSAFLDGVNAAALGLMAAVTWQLGRAAIVDPLTLALAVAAGIALLAAKVNSAWLVAAGAAVGVAYHGFVR